LSFKNISRDQTTSINTMHFSRLSAVLLPATAMPWLTVGTLLSKQKTFISPSISKSPSDDKHNKLCTMANASKPGLQLLQTQSSIFLDFKSGGCKDYEPPISVTDVEMGELFSKTGCRKADTILDEVAGEVKLSADGTTMGSIPCVAPELPGPSAGNNDECTNKGKLHDDLTWRCLSDEAAWLSRRSSDRDAGNYMHQNITRRREGYDTGTPPQLVGKSLASTWVG
jgi:hypothetical protein